MNKFIKYLSILLMLIWISSLSGAIIPNGARKNTVLKTFTYALTNVIDSTNAGINYIVINIPSQFDIAVPITNNVTVRDYYDNTTEKTLTTISFTTLWTFVADEAGTKFTNNELTIVLGSQITNMSTSSQENIYIDMNLYTSNDFTNAFFTAKVGAVQFDKMPASQKGLYATTGLQDVTGSAVVSRIPDPAYGFSSITPNAIIQGNDSYSFTYYIKSDTSYIEDINQAAILIPYGFTVNTNSVDSFLIDNDTSFIKITNIPDLAGTGTNVILIDYNSAGTKISAGGEMDIITFTTKGDMSKGSYLWKCWVDGNTVDSNSLLTSTTNPNFPSQTVDVSGAPPKVAGGIVKPVNADPVVLFNTITANTLEYKIENRAPGSEVDNKIQVAVITIPGIFTNVTSITSRKISGAYIKKVAGFSNTTILTLFYGLGGNVINPNYDYDIVRFLTYHSVPPLTTTNVTFSCVVNNSNGLGFYDLTVDLINDLQVTDPIPLGSVEISPDDGVVYTTDVTNSFTYKLYNTAPSGDIISSTISIPTTTFSTVLNINSSKGANITLNWPVITVDYTGVGNLQINQYDTITFDLVDIYTNTSVPYTTTITGTVMNATKTNYTSDKDVALDKTRNIYFTPQDARAKSWTKTKNFLSSLSTFTMVYVVSNYGEAGNKIDTVAIYFTNAAVNIGVGNVTSQFPAASILYLAGPTIEIYYTNANFDANQKDEITIIGDYLLVGSEKDYPIYSRVTVNTSTLVPTDVKSGDDIYIHFLIPFPSADSYITPNIIFTSTTDEINYLNYVISNTGAGQNDIVKAEIIVPSLYMSNMSIVSSTFINNDAIAITNMNNKLIVSYLADSSNFLQVGDKDIITLAITNSISEITNATFDCQVYNSDKNQIADVKSGKSTSVDIINQSLIDISPNTNYTTDVTNSYSFTIRNGTQLEGVNIIRARITIDTQYYDYNSLQVASDHNLYVTAKKTNIGSKYYYWIDYTANPLAPGNDDTFTFKIKDNITVTNTYYWQAEVDYNDGYGFRESKPESINANRISFVLPNVSAYAWITPNSIPDLNVVSEFAYTITNTGIIGNDIKMVRIKVPSSTFTNIVFLSNKISASNRLEGLGVVSNIVIDYAAAGSSLTVGNKDIIYFKAYDNWGSGAGGPFIWQSDAANTVDSNFVNPTTLNNISALPSEPNGQKVFIAVADYGAEADIYTPTKNPINTVNTVSTLIYYVKNTSKKANNDISEIRITIPTSLFKTNNILSNIISSNGGVISKQSNIIIINYGTAIPQDAKEYIVFNNIEDTYTHGSTNNIPFNIRVRFTTSGSNYITPVVTEGGKQTVDFEMPVPVASADINPKQIYTTTSTNVLTVRVTNEGDGSNDIDKVEIVVPGIFTNFIWADNITNRISGSGATNISYDSASQKITLEYGNSFNVNTADIFNFKIVDKIATEESRDWVFKVYNSDKSIDIISPFSPVVGVRTPPFASIKVTNTSDPNKIESTSITNDFEVTIDNKGSCTNRVLKALIIAPWPFVSITSATSTYGGTIINNITSITVDYGTNGLSKNAVDKIYFKASDSFEIGDTNFIYWKIYVNDGQGYADTQVPENSKQYVDFYTPDPLVEGNISPEGIFNTQTNVHFTYYLKNIGSGDNDIRKAVIKMPGVFSGLQNVVSSAGTVVTSTTDITINFGYNVFTPDTTIQVQFDLTNNFHIGETNVTFYSWAANVTNGSLYSVYVPAGKEQDVAIRIPSGIPLGYIVEPPQGVLFTLDTNKNIEYWIENNLSIPVSTAEIYITNNNFNILGVRSSYLSVSETNTNVISISNGKITIDYVACGKSLKKDDKDVITINISFSNNVTKYTITSFLDGTSTQPDKPGNDVLEIRVADFGRIIGTVWPYNEQVSVKLLDQNGNSVNVADKYTNIAPNVLIRDDTDGSDGVFMLDFIPPGVYDIEFAGPGDTYWKKIYVDNFVVASNQIYTTNTNPELKVALKNNPLRANESSQQTREVRGTITNANMSLIVPQGSIYEDIALDIYQGNLTESEKNDVSNNGAIVNISALQCDDLIAFDFDIEDLGGDDQTVGVDLKDECTLKFTYYPYYEDVLTSKGWNESDLAIFYWDETINRWHKIGGKVDVNNNVITAKVSYLHRRYSVFGSKKANKVIYDVEVDNNPFFPAGDNLEYQHTLIKFSLSKSYDKVEISIFNMLGEEVFKREVDTSEDQGMCTWDGMGKNGELVPSGAYIFQIKAGDEVYSGSILVIK